jgi:hypothetical protein
MREYQFFESIIEKQNLDSSVVSRKERTFSWHFWRQLIFLQPIPNSNSLNVNVSVI